MAGMRRDANGFTPMQAAIMEVLGDGEWHNRMELFRAIDDEDRYVLKQQINVLRKVIAPKGLLIVYSVSPTSGIGCQLVRRLSPMNVG